MVVRIMIMVPLCVHNLLKYIPAASHECNYRYAISSLISLLSLDAAFAIDAIRDIYEASSI
jgi:hypothetical protein